MEIELPSTATGMPPRHAPGVLEAIRANPSPLYSPVSTTLPGRCIDGRPAHQAPRHLTPALPGGFLSLLLGWALNHSSDPLWGAVDIEKLLRGEHQPCATHTGVPATPGGCGCGAIDSLPDILRLAASSPDLSEQIGLGPSTGGPASRLIDSCPSPHDVRQFAATDTEVTDLDGVHDESGILLNMVPGTTLDPHTLADTYGPVQFFHVDVWAMDTTGHWLADHGAVTSREVVDLLRGFTAAALVTLCGPGFPVIIHDEKSSK